jgi:hypothetical protein
MHTPLEPPPYSSVHSSHEAAIKHVISMPKITSLVSTVDDKLWSNKRRLSITEDMDDDDPAVPIPPTTSRSKLIATAMCHHLVEFAVRSDCAVICTVGPTTIWDCVRVAVRISLQLQAAMTIMPAVAVTSPVAALPVPHNQTQTN